MLSKRVGSVVNPMSPITWSCSPTTSSSLIRPIGGVVSTGSGNSSSVESGELVGSSERSRVSSDMDVCSEGSVEVTKIGKGMGYVIRY